MTADSLLPRRTARFGLFEADVELGELRREGRRVPIQEHSFLVLVALLERPGSEVSREELRRRLWPDQEFLDFENGINTAVGRLRQSLGDSADNPRYVGTRRGHGYRFLAPVEWLSAPAETQPASPPATQPAPAPRHLGRIAAAATLFVVAVMVALVWNRRPADLEPSLRSAIGASDALLVHAPLDQTLTGSFALSPDAARIALVTVDSTRGQTRLWMRRLDDVAATPVPGTEQGTLPFWSPDGRALGFFAGGLLKTLDVNTGKVTVVAAAPRGRGGSWSEAGTIVFAPDINSPILAVSASGGPARAVTDLGGAPSHRYPSFLPGGRRFTYLVLREDRDRSELRWAELDKPVGGSLTQAASNAAYLPPGYLLFSRGNTLLSQQLDADGLRLIGAPVVVSDQVGVYGEDGPTGLAAFSVSASGALSVGQVRRARLRFTWFDRNGSSRGPVGSSGDYVDFDLSPDGTRVAAVRFDERKRSSDLMALDLRTEVLSQVTDDPSPDGKPMWAPAGDWLAFSSLRDGRWRAVVRAVGRGADETLLPLSCIEPLSWMPDGKGVICNGPENFQLLTWPPNGSGSGFASANRVGNLPDGRVSPDGAWLAYASDRNGQREINVLPLSRGPSPAPWSLGPGDSPRWRSNGSELFYVAGRMLTAVAVAGGPHASFARPRALFGVPSGRSDLRDGLSPGDTFAVSPDGQMFLFAVLDRSEEAPAIRVARPKGAT